MLDPDVLPPPAGLGLHPALCLVGDPVRAADGRAVHEGRAGGVRVWAAAAGGVRRVALAAERQARRGGAAVGGVAPLWNNSSFYKKVFFYQEEDFERYIELFYFCARKSTSPRRT